jgi:hypothetical protein
VLDVVLSRDVVEQVDPALVENLFVVTAGYRLLFCSDMACSSHRVVDVLAP